MLIFFSSSHCIFEYFKSYLILALEKNLVQKSFDDDHARMCKLTPVEF